MNIGVIRERGAFDRRVALTPAVVRRGVYTLRGRRP